MIYLGGADRAGVGWAACGGLTWEVVGGDLGFFFSSRKWLHAYGLTQQAVRQEEWKGGRTKREGGGGGGG